MHQSGLLYDGEGEDCPPFLQIFGVVVDLLRPPFSLQCCDLGQTQEGGLLALLVCCSFGRLGGVCGLGVVDDSDGGVGEVD